MENTINQNINWVLGISFESANNLAMEFKGCPEAIPMLQDRIQAVDYEHLSTVDICLNFDDLFLEAIKLLRPDEADPFLEPSNSVVDQHLGQNMFIGCKNSKAQLVLRYLISTYRRCLGLKKELKSFDSSDVSTVNVIKVLSERILVNIILFLRGLTNSGCEYAEISKNFTRLILNKEIWDELYDLVVSCSNANLVDNDALSEVFGPVLDKLRGCILPVRLSKDSSNSIVVAERIFKTLGHLLAIKLPTNSRPIADLLISLPHFSPEIPEMNGLIFFKTSFLGPFVGLTIAQLQSRDYCFDDAEQLFTIEVPDEIEKSREFTIYRTLLASLRIELHTIFKSLLANAGSREATLSYLTKCLELNKKLTQMHPNYDELASTTAMLQLVSALLDLSSKIQLEKIQDDYIFHPKCRIQSIKDDSRINMDSEHLQLYATAISNDLNYTPTFNTECFYLTIEAIRIGIIGNSNAMKNLKRELPHLEEHIRRIEEDVKAQENVHPLLHARAQKALQMAKRTLKRMISSIYAYECLLYDPNILMNCADFTNKFLQLLMRSITPCTLNGNESNAVCVERFMSYPERYLETILDFFVILFRKDRSINLNIYIDFPRHIAMLLSNLHLIRNPHLGSKIVDLVFLLCINPSFVRLFDQIIQDRVAVERLFASLVKFYADVEQTGASSEFYDKFNIRRNIQIIFKGMWENLIQRDRMMRVARESSKDFIRFINMVINDTTFLLDESLAGLKSIHELEQLMGNKQAWDKLTKEQQQDKEEAYSNAKNQVTIWLQLGNQTIELFVDLTKSAPDVFIQDALGERVASMLNYNLVQLCGPKCAELKVRDALSRFRWNPKELTKQIVQIYINLAGDIFSKQMAEDERSYAPDIFASIIEKIQARELLPTSMLEMFKNLCERSEFHWQEKAQNEEDFGDDIPDEFRDEIIYTVMRDPVSLPSGQIVDRKNILRHLLSDPTNPFTRQPLNPEELKPETELKQRIDNWIRELRSKRSN